MDKLVIFISALIAFSSIVFYFLYCSELSTVCEQLGIGGGVACYIPGVNKIKLLTIGDIYADGSIELVPSYIGVTIPRIVVGILLGIVPIITVIATSNLVIGGLVAFVAGFITWLDFGLDMPNEGAAEQICISLVNAIPFIHILNYFRLVQFSKCYANGELLSMVSDFDQMQEDYSDESIVQDSLMEHREDYDGVDVYDESYGVESDIDDIYM